MLEYGHQRGPGCSNTRGHFAALVCACWSFCTSPALMISIFAPLFISSADGTLTMSLVSGGWRKAAAGAGCGFGMPHRKKFDFKNQNGIRRNARGMPCLPIGEFRRDEQLPVGSGFHELERLLPAAEKPVDRDL